MSSATEPSTKGVGSDTDTSKRVTVLLRRLRIPESATRVAERRAQAAESRALNGESQSVLLAAQVDRLHHERSVQEAAIREASAAIAGLGGQIDLLVDEARERESDSRRRLRSSSDPCPGFDTHAYLERIPDVRVSGLNPLLHYRRHGAAEGRLITPRREDR